MGKGFGNGGIGQILTFIIVAGGIMLSKSSVLQLHLMQTQEYVIGQTLLFVLQMNHQLV